MHLLDIEVHFVTIQIRVVERGGAGGDLQLSLAMHKFSVRG